MFNLHSKHGYLDPPPPPQLCSYSSFVLHLWGKEPKTQHPLPGCIGGSVSQGCAQLASLLQPTWALLPPFSVALLTSTLLHHIFAVPPFQGLAQLHLKSPRKALRVILCLQSTLRITAFPHLPLYAQLLVLCPSFCSGCSLCLSAFPSCPFTQNSLLVNVH